MTMMTTDDVGQLATRTPPSVPAAADLASGGPFDAYLNADKFDQLWRAAQVFAGSMLVPEHFRGHVDDCFIAIQMAMRLNVEPFMLMQNMYVVHGKPGIEAKFGIGLINNSGLFVGSLEYQVEGGEDARHTSYRVRAYATRRGAPEPSYGPWVDWPTVKAEGWLDKSQSKWKTIPALMFRYRAATFFGRLYCPELLLGMQTADEVRDVHTPVRPNGMRVFTGRLAEPLADADAHDEPMDDDSQLPQDERRREPVTVYTGQQVMEPDDPEGGAITVADLADWPAAERLLRDKMKDMGLSKPGQGKAMTNAAGFGLTPARSTPEQRLAFLHDVVAGQFDKDGNRRADPAAAG